MKNNEKYYGFSLIRNGLKYDYPFRESLTSLSDLTEDVFVALGNSDDDTENEVRKISKIHTIPTVWDESSREAGLILSQQTNIALEALRDIKSKNLSPYDWGIYLQADEVFHEDDYELIWADLKKAEEQECDAVRFRYLHFWLRADQLAIGKKWYPHEIRGIRLKSPIESYGDAQSFRKFTKVYESEARVFHYGHVREAHAYELKKQDFHKWWHPDHKIQEILKTSQNKDFQEKTLKYLGPHPKIMHKRMNFKGYPQLEKIYIVGCSKDYSEKFISSICAKEIVWCHSSKDFPKSKIFPKIILKPQSFWDQWLSKFSVIPDQMKSPQAKKWNLEFHATLLLSNQGVGVRSI